MSLPSIVLCPGLSSFSAVFLFHIVCADNTELLVRLSSSTFHCDLETSSPSYHSPRHRVQKFGTPRMQMILRSRYTSHSILGVLANAAKLLNPQRMGRVRIRFAAPVRFLPIDYIVEAIRIVQVRTQSPIRYAQYML